MRDDLQEIVTEMDLQIFQEYKQKKMYLYQNF